MTKFSRRLMVLLVLSSSTAFSQPQVMPAQSRGGLLYSTHCIGCHTTEMHWRDNRQTYDWDSLKVQVRRWQGNSGLQWGEVDIDEVSRYLNQTIYRYPTPADRVGLISPSGTPVGLSTQPR